MSTDEVRINDATGSASVASVDMKLEVVVIPVSVRDLAQAMIRAEMAHGKHEEQTGKADPNWPDWYAEYMVREQSGEKLPQ